MKTQKQTRLLLLMQLKKAGDKARILLCLAIIALKVRMEGDVYKRQLQGYQWMQGNVFLNYLTEGESPDKIEACLLYTSTVSRRNRR